MTGMASVRYLLRVAYLGGAFAGWQRQAAGRTVQGALEDALQEVFGTPVATVAAGRTDAGVHASGQAVHLDPPVAIPPAGLCAALNGRLPGDLRVLRARRVPPAFHARRDAVAKRYRYRLAWGGVLEPWEALRTWWVAPAPDPARVARAVRLARGTHDFGAFASSGHSGTGRRGTVRTLRLVRLTGRGRRLEIILEGDGFLRNMVRRLVGAAVEVGRGRCDEDWFAGLVTGEVSAPPAPTAPARGLTLEHVFYRFPGRSRVLDFPRS